MMPLNNKPCFIFAETQIPMELLSYDNHTFENEIFTGQTIKGREFQDCTFVKCDLSNSNFTHNKFLDCTFDNCNLSMLKLNASTLSNAVFKNCKILGVIFSDCHDMLFSVAFDGCVLDYSSFMAKKMTKTKFNRSSLKEVNFSRTNISESVFNDVDLSGAVFNQTNLSGANLINARNYSIEPELNIIKKASFSMDGIRGLLDKYQINIV
jgi:fluoroquinolone resistance protein